VRRFHSVAPARSRAWNPPGRRCASAGARGRAPRTMPRTSRRRSHSTVPASRYSASEAPGHWVTSLRSAACARRASVCVARRSSAKGAPRAPPTGAEVAADEGARLRRVASSDAIPRQPLPCARITGRRNSMQVPAALSTCFWKKEAAGSQGPAGDDGRVRHACRTAAAAIASPHLVRR
jgi:hypothetical protein